MSFITKILCCVAVLLLLQGCDDEGGDNFKPSTSTKLPDKRESGKPFNITGAAKNAKIKLNDKCVGVTLYQLQGDVLSQGEFTTDDKGEAAEIFYVSRGAVSSDCELMIGEEKFSIDGNSASNPAAGLVKFIGKWQHGNKTDELQVELGAKPEKSARLFLSVDGGAKWTEHKDLKWEGDKQANKSSLTYNTTNTDHNRVMLMVDGQWSFMAVPAVEQVHTNRAFVASNIWQQGEVKVKIDGIATEERVSCMQGLTAFYQDAEGAVTQFNTAGLSLTPDKDGNLDIIFTGVGSPNDKCHYVLSVGGAMAVLDVKADSDVPAINAVQFEKHDNDKKFKVALHAKPDGIEEEIELYIFNPTFFSWAKHTDTKTWTADYIMTDVSWVQDMHRILLKIKKGKTHYWIYRSSNG